MKSFTSLLFFAASVAAHGWVNSITIGGKAYPGHSPFSNGGASVIRQVTTNEPVLDPQGKDITCGPGAYKPASLVASAKAGDKILVDWAATSGNWFHDVGPMMTYLASCGSTTCDKFDASKAKWFKIQEQGQDAQGKWAQEKISEWSCYLPFQDIYYFTVDGSPASVTLPSTLAPGNYLLRSEIVALQNGMFPGKSEFYPSCAQLKVSGSGSGAPAASELVSLPGAYKPTDAGIKVDVSPFFFLSSTADTACRHIPFVDLLCSTTTQLTATRRTESAIDHLHMVPVYFDMLHERVIVCRAQRSLRGHLLFGMANHLRETMIVFFL
jgi:hypothetical protein